MSRSEKRQANSLASIAGSFESLVAGPASRDTSHTPAAEVVAGKEKWPIAARLVLAVGASEGKSRSATEARRSFPIMGYVGPNGGGKSAAMVKDTLPSLRAGRKVLSTVRLLDPSTGEPFDSYVPFTDFDQLLDLSHADVCMDEVVGIANSRSSASLSVVVQNLLVQLRRRDIVLRWTAPNWARADKIIREVTQAVTECRGYFAGPAQRSIEGEVRLWAPKRVFTFKTFDTIEFEEWSAGKRDKLKPVAKEWIKGPGSEMFRGYDTLDSVSMVSHAAEDGICSVCGKKKRQELCRGHEGHEDHAPLLTGNEGVHFAASLDADLLPAF